MESDCPYKAAPQKLQPNMHTHLALINQDLVINFVSGFSWITSAGICKLDEGNGLYVSWLLPIIVQQMQCGISCFLPR